MQRGFKAALVTKIKEYREEESISNIIHDQGCTNAKANAKKCVYFCVCFGIIYTYRNDPGGLQHLRKEYSFRTAGSDAADSRNIRKHWLSD